MTIGLLSCSTEDENYIEPVDYKCDCLVYEKTRTLVDSRNNIWIEEYPNPEGVLTCDTQDTGGSYYYRGSNEHNVVYGNGIQLKEFYSKVECPNKTIPIETKCNCEILYWREYVRMKNFETTVTWEQYYEEPACDSISTNGERFFNIKRGTTKRLVPARNWDDKENEYYEIKCKE